MDSNKKSTSRDLLSCGTGQGLREKLLIKPEAGRSLQTERVPPSSLMARLQSFLPQMAEANEKLRQQIEDSPAGRFDIEDVEEADRVIEMDVALVELDRSDSESDNWVESSDSEEDSDSDSEEQSVVTEENLKLPGHDRNRKRAAIQVVEHQGT